MSKKFKLGVIKYSSITFGSVLYAVAVSMFLDPNQLAPGGVVGISVILNRILSLPTGTLMLLINIPLLLLGIWKFGFKFFFSTIYSTVLAAVVVDIIAPLGCLTDDLLLASVFGAIILAIGVAIVFRAGATTGGTDILIRLLKLKHKHIETGRLFFITDFLVVLASIITFRDIETGLYAMVSIIVFCIVFDLVLYGGDTAKLVYVITDKETEIAKSIMDTLDIGVTYIKGEGAYTGSDKRVILCVAKKQLFPEIKHIVKTADPNAFLIVSSATDIYGEGFKDHFAEEF